MRENIRKTMTTWTRIYDSRLYNVTFTLVKLHSKKLKKKNHNNPRSNFSMDVFNA